MTETSLPWALALSDLLERRFGMATRYRPLIHRLAEAHEAGHVCLPLTEEDGRKLQREADQAAWLGRAGEHCPLILDDDRLYLYRHHRDEGIILQTLNDRAGLEGSWTPEVLTALKRFFPRHGAGQEQQDQCLATACTLLQRFSLIIGGPGTGKTSTVIRILALLRMQQPKLRVVLAAPTGKAAARLNEAMRQGAARLQREVGANELPDLHFEPAGTIHRLLGYGRAGIRHRRENPLPCDCLILDEASMIDQHLMARICEALPPAARLILLGDAHQLAAVEAGSVLADIAAIRTTGGYSKPLASMLNQAGLSASESPNPLRLADHVHRLEKSWRFGSDSAIGQLAACVIGGHERQLHAVLQRFPDQLACLPMEALQAWATEAYGRLPSCKTAADALGHFARARILTPHRVGPLGQQELNRQLAAWLLKTGPNPADCIEARHGLPFMILANDPDTGLFNGDTGIFWQEDGGRLQACLEEGPGQFRTLHPARLPAWTPAWVMTVHKSQGSEFDRVLVILPARPSPLLSRELLYTAITRARQACHFIGPPERLEEAMRQTTQRYSGLSARLQRHVRHEVEPSSQ